MEGLNCFEEGIDKMCGEDKKRGEDWRKESGMVMSSVTIKSRNIQYLTYLMYVTHL